VDDPDPASGVRLVGRQAEAGPVNVVVQNSYCFMGKNSSLVYRRAV